MIAAYRKDGSRRYAIIEEEIAFDGGTDIARLGRGQELGPVSALELDAPIPAAAKVICVGLNYRDHADEAGQPIPESPILFAKFGNTIVGPGAAIRIPPEVTQADYEAELAVVIGKTASRVSVDEARDHILGFTCLNDVSARDFQFADGQWVRGKSVDTFCPVGPWIAPVATIADPGSLAIRCVVNDQVVQESSTEQMIFDVDHLVSFISTWITMEPGDVIATGTPPGVGFARDPQLFLRPGDSVTVEIEGIGSLTNPVEALAVGGTRE